MVKLNWSPLQARGIVNALPHLPPWRNETSWRWPLLHDWASANQKLSPHAVETQLRFLTEDLRNALSKIGAEITTANTEEEATKAFRPYADKLAALMPLTAASPTRKG